MNIKSTETTKKTFIIKFEYETPLQLKKLKALSIFLGNFNPMRNELTDSNKAYELMKDNELKIDEMLYDMQELIK